VHEVLNEKKKEKWHLA